MDQNWIEELVASFLPSLSEEQTIAVTNKLVELDTESEDDLRHLQEKDLIPVLPVLKARKFIQKLKPERKCMILLDEITLVFKS